MPHSCITSTTRWSAWRCARPTTPSGTTHSVYDRAGHLLVEATDASITVREYVWLDDLPLAVVAERVCSPPLAGTRR